MFVAIENAIQIINLQTKKFVILFLIAIGFLLGFLPNYSDIVNSTKKFEYIFYIGNILFSFSLLSFFVIRRRFSKKVFFRTQFFTIISLFLLINLNQIIRIGFVDLSDNKFIFSEVIIVFLWFMIVFNISYMFIISFNNFMAYDIKNKINPAYYFLMIILIVIQLFNILNIDIMYSIIIAKIYPLILLITFLDILPQNNEKNELAFTTLFSTIIFVSIDLGFSFNKLLNLNNFLSEIMIFFVLLILAYRNINKLSYDFRKINDFSIKLARKMGELSLMHIEAQKSEIAKENFLATMSHEIRTPVNGIIGHAELLASTQIDEEQQRLLSMITISSNNLMKLVNEVLDLPNLLSGQVVLSKEVISVSELVESVIDVVSPKSFEKGLDLTYFIEPSVPCEIIGDYKRIGQILLNLCNNALKFTAKGEVFISVTQIDQIDENHVELLFEVKDTGIGISANQIKKLFKAYSQTDASVSRKFGGTGLGLAISAQLIELMKGKIWVESVVGRGTRFLFTFKCEISKVKKEENKHNYEQFVGLKCLLVSENPTMRYILGRRFLQWKIDAKIISNFDDIQRLIGVEQFKFIIVDIGAESKKASIFLKVNQINPINPIGKIPSIALVSLGKNATPDLHLITDETITKPLKTEMLAKAILKILKSKSKNNDNEKQTEIPKESKDLKNIMFSDFQNNFSQEVIKSVKILIAEDNPVNQKLVLSLFKKIGFIPKLVENGKLAVEEVEKDDYDLVFMDLQMPEMDGIQATKNIIINFANRKRPKIIALTANAMPGDKERCLAAGMDDYISKPIQLQLIIDTLYLWMNKLNLKEIKNVSNPVEQNNFKTKENLKLLVAEDNPVNQKLIMSILKKLGYSATLVENGALAYEAALKDEYDIIIMDLQMPVMDGLDASRNIKTNEKIKKKPIIIALTANAMEGDRERCLAAGMDEYMTKPIQVKLLEENLKKWGKIK
jgi:signal transduction histidine kinase/CheY-like chemotaxis protein